MTGNITSAETLFIHDQIPLVEGYSTDLFREKAVPNAIANPWQI